MIKANTLNLIKLIIYYFTNKLNTPYLFLKYRNNVTKFIYTS